MKIAISLPEKVYYEAEKAAKNLSVSQSALYLNALIEYLNKNNRKNITKSALRRGWLIFSEISKAICIPAQYLGYGNKFITIMDH